MRTVVVILWIGLVIYDGLMVRKYQPKVTMQEPLAAYRVMSKAWAHNRYIIPGWMIVAGGLSAYVVRMDREGKAG